MQFAGFKKPFSNIKNALSLGASVLALLFPGIAGAANIGFSGGVPFATHSLSGGGAVPTDGSFHFELGTFDTMLGGQPWSPTSANTDQWLDQWTAVTDPAGAPLDSATTEFTTISFSPFPSYGGFAGSVDLQHNNAPFTAGTRAYVWGYDTRDKPGSAEWILMTNISDDANGWTFPSVLNSASPTFSVGTANLTPVGDINGQNMTFGAVNIVPPVVPEPSTSLLAGLSVLLLVTRRRR